MNHNKTEPNRVPWEEKEVKILKGFLEKFGIEKLVLAAKMLKRDRKDVLEKWFEIMQASEGRKKIGRTVWTDQEDAKLS